VTFRRRGRLAERSGRPRTVGPVRADQATDRVAVAGLPESLGCFSLVNSPEPSDAGSNSSAEEDDDRDSSDEGRAAVPERGDERRG
jgi:hypothetical protein